MLGISICTYNRADNLSRLITNIKTKTTGQFALTVANDGSADRTIEVCLEHGVPYIGEVNRGISWNKNRALTSLLKLGCEEILVIEDDMDVVHDGWNATWVQAIQRYNHINWMSDSYSRIRKDRVLGGSGTPETPYVATCLTGTCMGFSARCLKEVGFFRTAFKGYGQEHIDLSKRCRSKGYGHDQHGFLHISGGLELLNIPPTSDKSGVEYNRIISKKFESDFNYVSAYADETEKTILDAETLAFEQRIITHNLLAIHGRAT